MKQEVYSCMRMIDNLKNNLINLHNIGQNNAIVLFQKNYSKICNVLKSLLTKEQYEMVQEVKEGNLGNAVYPKETARVWMEELIVATSLTSTYLHSLEMSIDKELIKKKIEIDKKEKELEIQQKEIESYKKLLKKSFEAISQFPEMQRSKFVEETKKSHRGIEEYTNPNTQSQTKKNQEGIEIEKSRDD